MAKKITIGNALLCEYVAQGSNNKHVLVNVFAGNVVVTAVPADIAFGLFIEAKRPRGDDAFTPEFEVLVGGKILFDVKMDGIGSVGTTITFIIQQFQVRVESPCEFEVYVKAVGYQRTLALKKEITIGPIPSPPPVSRLLLAQPAPDSPTS